MWIRTTFLTTALLLAFVAAMPTQAMAGAPCPTLIQGDMDGDGDVDIDDVALFDQAYARGNLKADWDFNCIIDINDLNRFIKMYLIGDATIFDFNLDGVVNIVDLGDFYSSWLDGFNGGSTIANVSNRYAGDGDCTVNFADLDYFIGWWQDCL